MEEEAQITETLPNIFIQTQRIKVFEQTENTTEGYIYRYSFIDIFDNQETEEEAINKLKVCFQTNLWDNQRLITSEYILKVKQVSTYRKSAELFYEPFLRQEFYYERTLENGYQDLSFPKKMMVLNSIGQALQVLSHKKIVHNYICTGSICVTEQSKRNIKSKLNNFYFSQKIDPGKSTFCKDFRHQQKKPFASPELRFQSEVGLKSDVWSLGALFYQMIFNGKFKIIVNYGSVCFKIPIDTPKWIQNALQNMLAFNAERRYDINRVSHILKSALVCVQATEKSLRQIQNNESVVITV